MKLTLDESMKNLALESLSDFQAMMAEPPLLRHGSIVALHNKNDNRFIRILNGQATGYGGPMSIDELPVNWDSERFLVIRPTKNLSLVALYGVSSKRYLRVIPDHLERVGVSVPKEIGDLIEDEEIFDVVSIGSTFKNNTFAFRSPATDTFLGIRGGVLDMKGKEVSGLHSFSVVVLHEPPSIAASVAVLK